MLVGEKMTPCCTESKFSEAKSCVSDPQIQTLGLMRDKSIIQTIKSKYYRFPFEVKLLAS